MSDLSDLESAWRKARDGKSGHEFGQALEGQGRISEAANVYQEMIDTGYLIGYEDLAWLEHDRGRFLRGQELLVSYLELSPSPGDETDLVAGVLGHWQWCDDGRLDAEALLRRGADHYPSARADLAHLLRATDRGREAEEVLRTGVLRGEVESYLPLGNLLEESGRIEEAIDILRQGFALGDAFSAYNLFLIFDFLGAASEASEWLWRAAEGGDEKAIEVLADVDDEIDP